MENLLLILFLILSLAYSLLRYPLLPLIILLLPLLLLVYIRAKNRVFNVTVRMLPLTSTLFILINLLSIFYFLFINKPTSSPMIYLVVFNKTLAIGLIIVTVFIFGLWSLGNLILRRINCSPKSSSPFVCISLGFFFYQFFLLVAYRYHLGDALVLSLPIILPLLRYAKDVKKMVVSLRHKQLSFELSFLEMVNFTFLTLIVAAVIVNNVRGFPIDHDGSVAYLNNAKIVSETGELLKTTYVHYFPYATEVVLSVLYRFGGTTAATLFLASFFILSLRTSLALLKKLAPKYASPYSSISLIFISPFFLSLSIYHSKVELVLVFLFLAALEVLLDWVSTKNPRYLIPLALLLATTLSVKLTAVYFVLPIILIVIYHQLSKTGSRINGILASSFLVLLTLASFSPWIFAAHSPIFSRFSNPENLLRSRLIEKSQETLCRQKLLQQEVNPNNPAFNDDLLERLKQPLNIFLGKLKNGTLDHSDPGANIFFLLMFIPFIFYKRKSSAHTHLSVIFLASAIIWYISSHSVLWYALPTFTLLPIIFTLSKGLSEDKKFLFIATSNNAVITTFYVLIYPFIVSFAPINLPPEKYFKYWPTSFATSEEYEAVKAANSIIENNSKALFLRYNFIPLPLFFLKNSNRYLIDSSSVFSGSENPERLAKQMRDFGITHLIVPKKGSFQSFSCGPDDFSKARAVINYTKEVFENSEIGIYELPDSVKN